MELGYVRKRHPLTSGKINVKLTRYVLDDALLRFWFRFVWPNTSLIARLSPGESLERLVRPELDAYFGYSFEQMCREAMPAIYAREGVTTPLEVGEYWDRETQIDVVGLRQDGWTDLGECKWTATRSPAALRAELEPRLGIYPNARNATISRRYFTRLKVKHTKPVPKDEHWHDLDDLYSL
jgi:uncharacterized protein